MLILGETDLSTTHPNVAAEVSPNSPIKATEVTAAATVKMLWRCELGHEWWATPAKRTNRVAPTNCPYCCNQKVLSGFNDLATTCPEMAKLISPNSPVKATEVTSGANKKVMWRCTNCGNDWWATPWMVSKKRAKDNCPYCTNKAVKPGFNDLATTHPDVAKQVSPNSPIKATEVVSGSWEKLLWQCPTCQNEWWAAVITRTWEDSRGCPYCSGNKILTGFNDLAATNPDIAAQVSPEFAD